VDATFGGGGHSAEILKRLTTGRLIAFDQDEDAERNVIKDERFLFIRQNFRFLQNNLRYRRIQSIDGLLADLGISSHHLDVPERGFSFMHSGELDMRMNRKSSLTAREILQNYSEEELLRVFTSYGEVRNSRKLVDFILQARSVKEIREVQHFVRVIRPCIQGKQTNKYLSQVFQALRIEVNQELVCLRKLLSQCIELIRVGGRLVVITYHSLEDRLVKNFIRSGNFEGEIEKDFYGNVKAPFFQVNRKVIVPGEEEIRKNNRARSAKLRIAERTAS
ncbi:MAG: 16S rRNA (cytosine(1402)-N(4))-methyltransferase RsmH, partial [Bacteroidales bacterium]